MKAGKNIMKSRNLLPVQQFSLGKVRFAWILKMASENPQRKCKNSSAEFILRVTHRKVIHHAEGTACVLLYLCNILFVAKVTLISCGWNRAHNNINSRFGPVSLSGSCVLFLCGLSNILCLIHLPQFKNLMWIHTF